MFYKIIKDKKVIDAIANPHFLRFLPSGHIAFTDVVSAQGITDNDCNTVYSLANGVRPEFPVVKIEKISEEEFSSLTKLLNSEQDVCADESELARVKRVRIRELSEVCSSKIVEGFTLRLSDGNEHGFKLTTEDQLNLLALENQLNTGDNVFVYHSTGLPCRIFMREDMQKIIKAYRKHVLYHTTYFNVAKQYINSLNSIDKVTAFSYGTQLAGTVKDLTIRQILLDGGSN